MRMAACATTGAGHPAVGEMAACSGQAAAVAAAGSSHSPGKRAASPPKSSTKERERTRTKIGNVPLDANNVSPRVSPKGNPMDSAARNVQKIQRGRSSRRKLSAKPVPSIDAPSPPQGPLDA